MPKNDMEHVRAVKAKYEASLLEKPNVIGVGIGLEIDDDVSHDDASPSNVPESEIVIIVNVTHKVPERKLDPEDRIPEELDDVSVQVQAVGKIRAFKKKRRKR